jgi:four helix bundle suffix protein
MRSAGHCIAPWLDHADPAVRANAAICLIHQANYLLDRQIAALEEAFVEDGGYSEQLATERLRRSQVPEVRWPMALRTAKPARPRQPVLGVHRLPRVQGRRATVMDNPALDHRPALCWSGRRIVTVREQQPPNALRRAP